MPEMTIEERNEAVCNMQEAADNLRSMDRAYCAAVLEELAREGRLMRGSKEAIIQRVRNNRLSQSNVRHRAQVSPHVTFTETETIQVQAPNFQYITVDPATISSASQIINAQIDADIPF